MLIRLPEVPNAALTENRRRGMHYRQYAKVLQEEKEKFYLLLLQERPSVAFSGRVDLSYRFHFKDRRMRDRDGLAQRLKVVQDLMGQPKGKDSTYKLGIIVDDSDKYINLWSILPTVYGASAEMLEIEITGLEDDETH